MSTISERKKDGKVIAFKFLACLGRDADGKRICKGTTWRPPEGLSYTKARKLAEAEAYRWEQELRSKEATLPKLGDKRLKDIPTSTSIVSDRIP